MDDLLGVFLVMLGIWLIGCLRAHIVSGKQFQPIDRIHVGFYKGGVYIEGMYIGGLPDVDKEEFVECLITEQDFVFTYGDWKIKELGRIPRDSINYILPYKDFYLEFDWDDENGQRQRTSFLYHPRYLGNDRDEACFKLRKYVKKKVKKKVQRLAPEENIDNSCLADVDSSNDKENE